MSLPLGAECKAAAEAEVAAIQAEADKAIAAAWAEAEKVAEDEFEVGFF